ncbi:MAG: hypothetical protein EXR66_04755 [Dehalococcoidia bacterium]|nr:hypothetical protein [Dehalococcoidia bacterium]
MAWLGLPALVGFAVAGGFAVGRGSTPRRTTANADATALAHDLHAPTPSTNEGPATNLESVLDRALQAVAGSIAQSGAIIERGELPTVRADAIALERVLVNLVANSLAHARPGQAPHIEVDARPE